MNTVSGRSLSCFLIVLLFLLPQCTFALSVGEPVVVQNTGNLGLRVRTGPSTDYSVIGKVYDGAKGTITSGPRNANGYTWWKVRWKSYHGWSVDYYDGSRLIVSDESALKPSISSVGDASAKEGDTLSFTVRLTASTSQTETYYYSTYFGGDATAERDDYDGAAEESIRVRSGQSSFTVRISTNEDADFDDETVYLYVTGDANHPNTTPSPSKYRGTGTIRDDDEPALKPSISSVGDASAKEGDTLSFTVRLTASTSQTETYYYSTYFGGDATAERDDYDGAAEESIRVRSGQSSFTVRISTHEDTDFDDETIYLYVTGDANHPNTTPSPSKYRGTGTIQDEASFPLAPFGTYRYTFSLDSGIYTVTSDQCYSRDRNSSAIERYVSGLKIYNNRNELVRPPYDILFQLTAAHASACVLAGIDFETFLDQIDVAIEDVRMFDTKFREAAGLEGRSDISSLIDEAILGTEVGWSLGEYSAGVATSAVTGLKIVKTVLEFYGRKLLGDKKEETANLISDVFFAANVRELEFAKDWIQTLERVDLARNIDITDLHKKMVLLDHIETSITIFNNLVPAGQNYARRLYPALTLSGFDKFTEEVNRFFYEEFSPVSLLLDSISFSLIIDELHTTLSLWDISLIKNSPFDVLNNSFNRSIIDDYALTGTSDADVMYNYAPGAQLYGRDGNDWMYGENVSTVMFGEDGDDHLFGGSRDDVLTGGKGNDELKGGGGQDFARFEETRSNYDIRWDGAMEWLTVSSSADGSDRVYRDIESLSFLDGIVQIQNIEGTTRNSPPVLVGNIENQTAIAGERFNFYIPSNLFVDPDEDRLTWSVSGLPNWLTFDSNRLLLSGTPASSDAGRWTITVGVVGSSDSETFTLSVINLNAPPVFTVPSDPYIVEDSGWMRLSGLSVTDADNDDLTMIAAVKYGELKATGTMVVDVDVATDTLFSDMVGFRPSPGSSITTVLATLEYRPPRNWEAGQDLLFLLVSDGIVQDPVYDFALIYPETEPVLSGPANKTSTITDDEAPPPAGLVKISGDEQEGPAGVQLAEPFVVEVRDQNGSAFAGAVVTFAVTDGEGTLSATTATTDVNGQAATTLMLGSTLGANIVSGTVAGLEPVTFSAVGQDSLFADKLAQNAPNPFNSQTIFSYFLYAPGTARLEVFTLTGQRVAVLHQGPQKVGYHQIRWDARNDAGRPLASGTYLYRLVTAEGVLTRKLTLLR